MTAVTAWRTDEPCPVCATGLILHDDGTSPPRAECRLCGWSDTWTGDHADGGEPVTEPLTGQGRPGRSGWPCRWPGRWSRTWPSSTAPASARSSSAAPTSTPARWTGARPVRAHPGPRLPVLRRTGQDPARCAVPGRLAPRGRTRPDPRPGHRRPAVVGRRCAPRPSSPATRPTTAGQDTADFDELIRELDEEITKSGVRGNVAPDRPARRHRSTRRRQDAPDLPQPQGQPAHAWARPTPRRTARRSAPRCSSRLTCPSYGRVDHQGVPVDPARLRLRPGRPGRADLRRAVRPVHPEPAPLPRP